MRYLALVLLAGCWSSAPKKAPENHTDPVDKPVATRPSGNGTARLVQRTQTGGVIELDGARPDAMTAANREMEAHCGPANFTIVQEGEEAIGTDDTAAADGTVSARTTVAWRVHYQCNGAGGP